MSWTQTIPQNRGFHEKYIMSVENLNIFHTWWVLISSFCFQLPVDQWPLVSVSHLPDCFWSEVQHSFWKVPVSNPLPVPQSQKSSSIQHSSGSVKNIDKKKLRKLLICPQADAIDLFIHNLVVYDEREASEQLVNNLQHFCEDQNRHFHNGCDGWWPLTCCSSRSDFFSVITLA